MGALPVVPVHAFEWWEPYRRALRRSRLAFALGVTTVAIYVLAPLVTLYAVASVAEVGPWRRLDDLQARLGIAGVVGAHLVALALVAAVVASLSWHGVTRRALRRLGARPATAEEAAALHAACDGVAIARGMPVPPFHVVDDRAPNALALGRAARATLVITRSALRLPADELVALCAHEMVALSSVAFSFATAAIDTVLFAEWCTRVLWVTAVVGLLSSVVGVPPGVAAAYAACILGLVLVTRVALLFADRELPRLLDSVVELVDLEAVRVTEGPAPYARMLERLQANHEQAGSPWQLAHRWGERDVVPADRRRPRPAVLLVRAVVEDEGVPVLARRCRHADPAAMARRIDRAVAQHGAPVGLESGNGRPRPQRRRRRR